MRRFVRDERGIMSVHNLFLTIAACAVGAAGLDVTHLFAARTQLQVAADIGAHTALLLRHRGRTVHQATTAAIAAVEYGMPPTAYGTVVEASDIVYGTWNEATRSFTPTPVTSTALPSAAQVTTRRADDNPVQSFLLRIIGVDEMDVVASATYTTYYPPCLSEGFVARKRVDLESLNTFNEGFCLHSEELVTINQNNTFKPGTVVSMPDHATYYDTRPDSTFTNNTGFREALRDGHYELLILDRVRKSATLPQGVLPFESALPAMGTGAAVPLVPGNLLPTSFQMPTSGYRVHNVQCTTNGKNSSLTLTGGTYRNIILMTNCPINFSGRVNLEDAVIFSTFESTNKDAFSTSSGPNDGLVLGRNDNCADGGGATLITRGSMGAASKLTLYGGQILALGDVRAASGIYGQGLSVVSDGMVNLTTRTDAYTCGRGMNRAFQHTYFRLAQ